MIENDERLAATLKYMAKLAGALEGLRLGEEEKGNHMFAACASGFLHELRKNLDLTRDYATREVAKQQIPKNGAYTNGHSETTSKVLVGA